MKTQANKKALSGFALVTRLLLVCQAVLYSSCDDGHERPENKDREITSEVRSTLEKYCEDIRRSGLMSELNYLDTSSRFFWVPPGYSSPLNYDSVVAAITRNAVMLAKVDNTFEKLTVIPLASGLASYTGLIRSVVTDTTGRTTQSMLTETGVVIRRRDGWKLLCGQTGILE